MIDVRDIRVADIETGQRLRQIDEAQVGRLENSILEVGLLNPITVYAIDEVMFGLVAGAHRLEAYKRTGHDEIPATVVEFSDLERQLAECDENLCGSRLSPVEEALFLQRRKEAYEAIHPETKHGANLENARVDEMATHERANRFTVDTAAKTGQSERVIQRKTERGEKVIDEVLNLIRGTKLDTGTYLDKLKGLRPNEQVTAAKRDLAHERSKSEQPKQGGVAGQYKAADASEPRTEEEIFARFIALVDEIEALKLADLVVGAGRKRAVLGQRASSLADRMSEIMEAIA